MEWQHFMTRNLFKKLVKSQQQQNKTNNFKHLYQIWELNPKSLKCENTGAVQYIICNLYR